MQSLKASVWMFQQESVPVEGSRTSQAEILSETSSLKLVSSKICEPKQLKSAKFNNLNCQLCWMTRNRGGSPHVNFASFELWWTTFLKMLLPKLSSINYGLFWLFFDNFFWPKFSKINSEIFFLSVFWLISLLPLFGFFLLICLIGFNGKPLIRLMNYVEILEGFRRLQTEIQLLIEFNPNWVTQRIQSKQWISIRIRNESFIHCNVESQL